jgi:ubiquinone/menaquinone biosynthesis C-methylase UbiE
MRRLHKIVDRAALGARVYSRAVLAIYDPLVIHFENTFVWKCPSQRLLDFYNRHVSANHLDVGVGTGWFLDRCQFPSHSPQIALLDLNPNSLRAASRRICRYRPAVYRADVLMPLPSDLPRFDSIGMNFLLHCLPGPPAAKAQALTHLTPLLNPGGLLFGSTILGKNQKYNWLGRLFVGLYNSRLLPGCRVLDNREDGLDELEAALKAHFSRYSIETIGHVAMFAGHI